MKRIKFIINPSSGRQTMEKKIDDLCKLLLDDGFIVGKFFTEKKDDAMLEAIKTCNGGHFDYIVACGGDGTVNEVVKGIMKSSNKLPLAIFASGTVNDFANYLNIPKGVNDFFEMLKSGVTMSVDLGKVNDDYFVNVAAGGILTNIAYQVPGESKAILGRLAYYLEGIKEFTLQSLDPINVKIISEEINITKEEILLFLISNSSSIGGFKKLAPNADVVDGLLDVIIIKKSDVADLANIFINVLTGDHINHPNVLYFKVKSIYLESDTEIPIDIDGEYGGNLPAKFEVIPGAIKIFI